MTANRSRILPRGSLLVAIAGILLGAASADAARVFTGRGDLDFDGDVDALDYAVMQQCAMGPVGGCTNPCVANKTDFDGDGNPPSVVPNGISLVDQSLMLQRINNPSAFESELAVDATTIYNATNAPTFNFHCRELLVEAYDSLGFSAPDAIRGGDTLFCGNHYLAWLDDTGFYGELNALWQLNNLHGSSLDFIPGPDGLVRNMLISAENRDGQWADGFSGSIHLEVLSHVPDSNDVGCSTFPGPACNGYGINEAGSFTRSTIPWWTSCNGGSPSFTDRFAPKDVTWDGSSLVLKRLHEARLTKEADFDGSLPCENAHQDWLFPDGTPRPLWIDLGWELFGQEPKVVFTTQVRNPAGNPAPGGHGYPIVDVTLTSLVSPPPGKEFRNWVRPSLAHDTCGAPPLPACPPGCASRSYAANTWNFNAFSVCPDDYNLGFSPIWELSSTGAATPGRYIQTYNFRAPSGPPLIDNQPCECYPHDSLSLVNAAGDFFNLPGGQTNPQNRKVILLAPGP